MSVRLGPFEILDQFATGGMGEIWRGKHVEQEVPVAIKVITGPNALLPEFKAEFRREVQAVARLNHPNIVQVYDYGVLPEEVRELPGNLLPGAPYLVMEYASRGSLADSMELNWRDLKNILMAVLGGLAHAHARGVIHRDIKPGNVLLGSHHESPPRIILTDFGVAHATDRMTRTDAVELTSRSTEEASGTPRYMAPEQFMGKWRDYVPATDLYAVGVMAYHMACGELPFKGATFMLLAMAHINNPFPALQPNIDVPDGFEAWIRRLTEKDPHDRFKSAANAAWALTQLDDTRIFFKEFSSIVGDQEWGDEDEDDSTDMLPTRMDFALPEAIRVFTMSRSFKENAYKDVPPLPVTWQEAEPPKAQLSLIGAGLGLFGLRSIPLVARQQERTRLWDAFKDVHTKRNDRVVVIRGWGGTGKSGLAEWFVNLVDEIGAASTFHATHSANPGPMHGLGWMLNGQFRCAGLNIDDLKDRLEQILERADIEDPQLLSGLVEIMRTDLRDASTTSTTMVRFAHADQRYTVVRDVIDRTAPERPVVYWLDDVHFEPDTVDFVRWSLENRGDDAHPRLFILTVREEELDSRPDARQSLKALLERPEVEVIELQPLSVDDTAQLVQEHLYLPIELARDVARRSAGSPLFAIQLVEDWIKRGVLEVGSGTFEVKPGETADLPSDSESLWKSRLANLVAQLSAVDADETKRQPVSEEDARAAIELAACFGEDVNTDEWLHALGMRNIAVDRSLVDELVRLRLAKQSDEGFSFINAQLVDMLRNESKEAGRWPSQNMLCARMLTTRYGEEHPGLAQRVGRHFLEADSHLLAVTCLEEAYQRAHGTAEQREINEINELLGKCYEAMNVKPNDIRWAELWVRRAVPKIYSQDPDVYQEGIELLKKSEAIAREIGRKKTLAGILRAQAWASIHGVDVDSGIAKATEALELSRDNAALEASCHRTLGHLLLVKGEIDAATEHLRTAAELAPNSVHAIWARQQLASAALLRGQLDEAEELLQQALVQAQSKAVLMAEAQIYETWGFLAERRGDPAAAEERHRQALNLRGSISSDSTLHAKSREYVARAVLAQRRFDEAHEMLRPLADRLAAGARGYYTHLEDALLACAAGQRDWDAWKEHFEPAFSFAEFPPSAVHARGLLLAARLAREAGKYSLARETYQRGVDLLLTHDLEIELAETMDRERGEILALMDEGAEISEISEVSEPSVDAPVHDFPDAPSAPYVATSAFGEDSDAVEEPDFTGRVQVLSLPMDPKEALNAFAFDLSSESDEEAPKEPPANVRDVQSGEVPSIHGVLNPADLPAALRLDEPSESKLPADPIDDAWEEIEASVSTGSREPVTADDVRENE